MHPLPGMYLREEADMGDDGVRFLSETHIRRELDVPGLEALGAGRGFEVTNECFSVRGKARRVADERRACTA